MNCESCPRPAVACTSEWRGESLIVLYWCPDHAPEDAEWYYEKPKYTRNDVDYDTWYSEWMKQLAKTNTLEELDAKLHGAKHEAKKAAAVHLRAIQKTHSMSSNSQARAQARNATAAAGDYGIALRGAIEIHILFPDKL